MDTTDGPGIAIQFSDPPTYKIRRCQISNQITIPGTNKYRIWTFEKQDESLHLYCNDVKVNEFNYMESVSDNDECKEMWSYDFAHVKFVGYDNLDNASDYMRQYKEGKLAIWTVIYFTSLQRNAVLAAVR